MAAVCFKNFYGYSVISFLLSQRSTCTFSLINHFHTMTHSEAKSAGMLVGILIPWYKLEPGELVCWLVSVFVHFVSTNAAGCAVVNNYIAICPPTYCTSGSLKTKKQICRYYFNVCRSSRTKCWWHNPQKKAKRRRILLVWPWLEKSRRKLSKAIFTAAMLVMWPGPFIQNIY